MNPTTARPDDVPPLLGQRSVTAADRDAIHALLRAYTESVESGDRQRFEALLFATDIPFRGVAGGLDPAEEPADIDIRSYPSFRSGVFESGGRYRQSFHNETIEQDGNLASVSLDFVTTVVDTGRQIHGWKILHLLKVQGQWKIVSEFYTRHLLESGSAS
ncbi:nuclear transport factor 2 family protein [Burkholderia sp. A1]|uniref:nuclear transport factor 2 family protein n=1 Tax=Burkholderia sp. A1 TaxID=148446 RepID=UPI000468EADF|nr:nuclear transport factor 2 family protein [Burkholderia sp. A1]